MKKKKILLAALIAAIAAGAAAGVDALWGRSLIADTVRTVFVPFQSGVSHIANSISGFREFIWEMRGYRDENERLIKENYELRKQLRPVEEYRAENGRLKELLGLREELSTYETVAGQVISYEPNNWYDTIVINRGTANGVKEGDPVVTDMGVVGKVTEAGLNWCRVSSVLNTETAVGVRLIRTGEVAVVEGDATLAGAGQCKLSFIDRGASLIIGDILETSGAGGIYPAGISVGSVTQVNQDSTGALQYAVVEPSVSFGKLYEVIIITDMER